MSSKIIVGIDLGTTNSVVSILDNKIPRTILVDQAKLLPSVVSLTDNGVIVGKVAKNMAILEPEKTIGSIKRKMGQDITVSLGNLQLRPEEISAFILSKIKKTVAEELKLDEDEPLRVVITVPAYFTEEQRAATKQAADIASLQVERIINEPTAAALAFGLSQMDEAIYAIYDLGGGTFDVSIIESNEGLVEVLATTGNNELGGDDFDHLLADWIWAKFTQTHQLQNAQRSTKEQARLIRIAEQTKIKLSTEATVSIQENFFYKNGGQSYHLELTVTKNDFEALIKDKIRETVLLLEKAIDEAKIELDELDGIILVGGSSRIPLVGKAIEKYFSITPSLIDLPDEAVSHGATIQGAIIDKIDISTVLIDITPHSLGIGVRDYEAPESFLASMFRGGNPDEHLATAILIPKNTPIPAKKTEKFNSVVEFQKAYEIKVAQGEDRLLKNNKAIGETLLKVSKPVEEGEIEVTFELDLNGLLKVTAIECNTKDEIHVEFKSSRGKKIRQAELPKQVQNTTIVAEEEANNSLTKRAEELIATGDLNEEDQEELQTLVKKYKAHIKAEATAAANELETEILDLLYYLEGNDD